MKILFFVEGDTDKFFIEEILGPQVNKVEPLCYTYAQKPRKHEYVKSLISNVRCLAGDYIYICDADCESPNIEQFCSDLILKIRNLKKEKVIISVFEVESWFIAGLNSTAQQQLRLTNDTICNTHRLTKEAFESIARKNGMDVVSFQNYCRENYDLLLAKSRSNSLCQLIDKLSLIDGDVA